MPLQEAEGIDLAPHPKSATAVWFPSLIGYTIFSQKILWNTKKRMAISLKFRPFCVEENLRNLVTIRTRSRCFSSKQCWGSVTFWCGSGSPDPYLWLMDLDPALDSDPDPTPSCIDFKDVWWRTHCSRWLSRRHVTGPYQMFKGSLTRDFRAQFFFMNQCPPGP